MNVRHIQVSTFLCVLLISLLSPIILKSQKLIFSPQWTAQSQFAGYYVALEKGFYKEAGLDVSIIHHSASNSVFNLLKTNKCNIITCQLLQAMVKINEGLDLVNILQTSQNNSLMIIGHNHIKSINDLKGKKVGRWKSGFYSPGLALDKEKNLDIEWIPFVQNVNLFISKAIDATLAMSYNEYFQILTSGINLSNKSIFYFSDLGYNIPEDGIYVTQKFYNNNKEALAKFSKASIKGWQWAEKNQEETLDIILKYAKANHIPTNRAHQEWMLKEIIKLQKDKKTGKATYLLKDSDIVLSNKILKEIGGIKKDIVVKKVNNYAQ